MSRILRFGKYFSWTVVDQFINLGIPRLILFPILASMMTDDAFGSFVITLGAIQMIGLAPSNGLIGYIIRDYITQSDDRKALLTRTTLMLSLAIMIPTSLMYILGAKSIAGFYGGNTIVMQLLPMMAIFLLLTNVVETLQATYRVHRKFKRISLVHGLQTALLFLAIPLYYQWQMRGIAVAYIIAGVGALMFVGFLERRTIFQRPMFSRSFAKSAMKVWPAFSIAAMISLSAGYLDRMLLGYWWSPADVKPFFAAVSMASLVAIPGTLLAGLIFSLLGSVKQAGHLNRKFYVYYVLGVCASSVVVLLIGWFVGRWLLELFYPDVADVSMTLWYAIMAGFAIFNVGTLFRPFVSKFLSPKILPVISIISFVARITPLVILIPTQGAMGAAQGLLIGMSITSCMWLILYIKKFIFSLNTKAVDAVDVQEPNAQPPDEPDISG